MPLIKGNSPKTISKNISEFHGGKTYAHTAAKFGKERADKQAIAAAMDTARRYRKKYAEGGLAEGDAGKADKQSFIRRLGEMAPDVFTPESIEFAEKIPPAQQAVSDHFYYGVRDMLQEPGKQAGLIPSDRTPEEMDAAARAWAPGMALGMVGAPRAVGAGPVAGSGVTRPGSLWHASGKKFEKFDKGKFGTGEGNADWGFGTYVAESPAVSGLGGYYDKVFTALNLGKSGEKWDSVMPGHRLSPVELTALGGIRSGVAESKIINNIVEHGVSRADAAKILNNVSDNKASVYQLSHVKDKGLFINFDKPWHEQKPEVVKILTPYIKKYQLYSPRDITGNIAAELVDNGILGGKYLDKRSRQQGHGTRNYVIYDTNALDIERRFSRGGMAKFQEGGEVGESWSPKEAEKEYWAQDKAAPTDVGKDTDRSFIQRLADKAPDTFTPQMVETATEKIPAAQRAVADHLYYGIRDMAQEAGKQFGTIPSDRTSEEMAQAARDWAPGMALGMVGLGRLPGGAPPGAVGSSGSKLTQPHALASAEKFLLEEAQYPPEAIANNSATVKLETAKVLGWKEPTPEIAGTAPKDIEQLLGSQEWFASEFSNVLKGDKPSPKLVETLDQFVEPAPKSKDYMHELEPKHTQEHELYAGVTGQPVTKHTPEEWGAIIKAEQEAKPKGIPPVDEFLLSEGMDPITLSNLTIAEKVQYAKSAGYVSKHKPKETVEAAPEDMPSPAVAAITPTLQQAADASGVSVPKAMANTMVADLVDGVKPKNVAKYLFEVAHKNPEAALAAKELLPKKAKSDINKALWNLTKDKGFSAADKELVNSLYSSKAKKKTEPAVDYYESDYGQVPYGYAAKDWNILPKWKKKEILQKIEKAEDDAILQDEYELSLEKQASQDADLAGGIDPGGNANWASVAAQDKWLQKHKPDVYEYKQHLLKHSPEIIPTQDKHIPQFHIGSMHSKAAQDAVFLKYASLIPDWTNWQAPPHGQAPVKFPKAENAPKSLGWNETALMFKGGKPERLGHIGPVGKNVKRFYAGHRPEIAEPYTVGYGAPKEYLQYNDVPYDTYIYRAPNNRVFEVNFPTFNGGNFNVVGSSSISDIVRAARRQNADAVVIHNTVDVATGQFAGEPHTQYVILNMEGLRSPDARFEKKNIGINHSHYGFIAGFPVFYNLYERATGDSGKEDKNMQKGGRAMASGGFMPSKWVPRPRPMGPPKPVGTGSHVGMIRSAIPGRTDKIGMNVKGGSYVIPADVVSGVGEGNSMAGAEAFNSLLGKGPYGAKVGKMGAPKANFGSPMRMATPSLRMPRRAEGGDTEDKEENVPIIAAGGEFVVPPEVVRRIGSGDMKRGHEVLDELVLHLRKKTIHEMRRLKGPKK